MIEQVAAETADGPLLRRQSRRTLAWLFMCVTPGEEKTIREAYGLPALPQFEDVRPVSSAPEILAKL